MTQAQIIEAVLQAPPERRQAILAAARGGDRPSRMGTVQEAAELLGTCGRTVERYARQGRIRRVALSPRKIRYDLSACERLLAGGV